MTEASPLNRSMNVGSLSVLDGNLDNYDVIIISEQSYLKYKHAWYLPKLIISGVEAHFIKCPIQSV